MNEDKRQTARTQGRYSNNKEFHTSKKEKDKSKNKKTSNKEKLDKGEKSKPTAAPIDGIELKYEENSGHSFKELEEKRKPQELRFSGIHDLSTTPNGESRLLYDKDFIPREQSEELMEMLESTTEWYDKNIIIHGEEFPQPRLVAWYGPFPYTYSGATLEAAEMPSVVKQLKERIEKYLRENGLKVELNSVLLNLYRNEKDSVAWHSDDELTMGVCPTIASVSLGEVRKFEMRPKKHVVDKMSTDHSPKYDPETILYVNLTPGSLLIMDGCMQQDWQHRVPKEFHDKSQRINLTFRTVYPIDQLPPYVPTKPTSNSSKVQVPPAPKQYALDDDHFPTLDAGKSKNKKPKSNKPPPCDSGSTPPELEEEPTENRIDDVYIQPPHGPAYDDVPRLQEYDACMSTEYEDPPSLGSRSTLNADAPVFQPSSYHKVTPTPSFSRKSLYEMAALYRNQSVSEDDMGSFVDTLFDLVKKDDGAIFLLRDWHELYVYLELHDGSLTKKNLDVIVARMVSMIYNAKFQRAKYQQQSSSHSDRGSRDGYSKPRSYSGRKY